MGGLVKRYPTCGFEKLKRFPHISCNFGSQPLPMNTRFMTPNNPPARQWLREHVTPNWQHICLGIPASKFIFFCASKPAGSSTWTLFGFGILDTKSLFVNPRWKNSGTHTPREKTSLTTSLWYPWRSNFLLLCFPGIAGKDWKSALVYLGFRWF